MTYTYPNPVPRPQDLPELATVQEVCDVLRITVDEFHDLEIHEFGPPCVDFGIGIVRYARNDVLTWIRDKTYGR
jgi:hypothetical protein